MHDILDRAFAEGRLAHQHRALQILHRAGHDLGAARAAFVHQNRQREMRPLFHRRRRRIIVLLRSDAALRGNDLRSRREKLRADIHRHIQKPARIIPQIEHQRLHPLLL